MSERTGADGAAASTGRPGPLLRRLLRLPARLYDRHAGWLLGHRFLRLTHTGRRSGRRFHTVLEVVGIDPTTGEIVVLAGFGTATDWYRNVRARPDVEIEIGRFRFRAVGRVLDPDEAVAALADYERRNRLVAPVVRRVLSGLVHWTYDGSAAARQRLVRQLPLVAFRPVPADTARRVG